MTTSTATKSLLDSIRGVLDSCDNSELVFVATLLRLQQLMDNVLHPDDCCGWYAEGADPAMRELGAVLLDEGLMSSVDHEARKLFAEIRLARTTLREIKRADSDWGQDIATAESWTDAAADIHKKEEA
jgi:hypothetical protein